jgi:predicted acylesterase/phospholipase RssA
LGLTSADIETILKSYPFNEEFLPNNELHEGKYRMVGMDATGHARILVAEDSLTKLGEHKISAYQYSYAAPEKIGSSFIKGAVRGFIVSEVIKIILLGLKNRLEPIRNGLNSVKKFLNNPDFIINYPRNILDRALSFLGIWNDDQIRLISSQLLSLQKGIILQQLKRIGWQPNRWKLLGIFPANNLVPAIGNLMWDRGIYAGFEVRDFFFKIILLALSKDTHFRRGLGESDLLGDGLTRQDIEGLQISFNEKFEVIPDPNSKRVLDELAKLPERLTFKELKKIIKLNLTVCVTNVTTNQPIYFSDYFTPDFPVLEALGASMSFPIAFKPIYNEANVLLTEPEANPGFVNFLRSDEEATIYKQTFKMSDYNHFLAVVLKFVKDKKGLQISTNGNLSFRSFLPYLRRLISDPAVAGEDRRLCSFFYNSAFKGLLIDGGVTNNLPVSVFSFTTDEKGTEFQDLGLKTKVLSLKLDNSFPPEMKSLARGILDDDKNGKGFMKQIEETDGLFKQKVLQYSFGMIVGKKLRLKRSFARNTDLMEMPQEVWIKIGKELIEEYRQNKRRFTPWNRQVNAISGLMSSLQFGMDQGQIENVTDNENIIPLYCYGIDTLDFDLTAKDMVPLVNLAVQESEVAVRKYFSENKDAE